MKLIGPRVFPNLIHTVFSFLTYKRSNLMRIITGGWFCINSCSEWVSTYKILQFYGLMAHVCIHFNLLVFFTADFGMFQKGKRKRRVDTLNSTRSLHFLQYNIFDWSRRRHILVYIIIVHIFNFSFILSKADDFTTGTFSTPLLWIFYILILNYSLQ